MTVADVPPKGKLLSGEPPPGMTLEDWGRVKEDREWLGDALSLLAPNTPDMYYTVAFGEPWSKSRPRFANRRAYQGRDDRDAEQLMRAHLQQAAFPMKTGNVFLACRFYRSNHQRIDADNLLKHICDSANGVLWIDDSQVTATVAEVQYDPALPRTVIMAASHESSLRRGTDREITCKGCAKRYLPAIRGKTARSQEFCSYACWRTTRTDITEPVPCPQCGEPFRRYTSTQKFCSTTCAGMNKRGVPKNGGRSYSACSDCGKPLSHYRGGRCRSCWRTFATTTEGAP